MLGAVSNPRSGTRDLEEKWSPPRGPEWEFRLEHEVLVPPPTEGGSSNIWSVCGSAFCTEGGKEWSDEPALLWLLEARLRDEDWPLPVGDEEEFGLSLFETVDVLVAEAALPAAVFDFGLFGPRTRPSFAYSHTNPRVMHRLQEGCSPLHY